MKKSESGKFPSFRQQFQKRPSAFDIQHCSLKPQFGHDPFNEGQSNQMISTQPEIAKRIQNRIRLRKATESEKRISRQAFEKTNTSEKLEEPHESYKNEQFLAKLEYYWENSEQISIFVNSAKNYIDPLQLKSRLLKETGILQCQVEGQNVEQVLIGRLKKLGDLAKSQKKCKQRVEHMELMIEERMKKLSDLLKPR